MSLSKDFQMQYVLGSAGEAAVPGQPATAGYWSSTTVEQTVWQPYQVSTVAATPGVRIATQNEAALILGQQPNNCAMEIAILTFIMTAEEINVLLYKIQTGQYLIITNISADNNTGLGLCVITVTDPSTIQPTPNPVYNPNYTYTGEIPGCAA